MIEHARGLESAIERGAGGVGDRARQCEPVMERASGEPVIERASGEPVIERGSGEPVIERASGEPVIERASGERGAGARR
jgi:hypothetical protein